MSPQIPGTRVVPKIVFPVADMEEAVAFYQGLGFTVETFDNSYAWVTNHGDEVLHLALAPEVDPANNLSSGYLHVQHVDDWHALLREAGVDVGTIENRPWQMREFSIHDPSGNSLRVGANL